MIDFGAGGGLCAIAASLQGARSIEAFEIDALALLAIELNASANAIKNIQPRLIDLLKSPKAICDCNVLIAADVFYEQGPAVETLAFIQHQARHGVRVIAGDPERKYFPRDAFRCLATYDVPVDPDLEGVEVRRTSVWEL